MYDLLYGGGDGDAATANMLSHVLALLPSVRV